MGLRNAGLHYAGLYPVLDLGSKLLLFDTVANVCNNLQLAATMARSRIGTVLKIYVQIKIQLWDAYVCRRRSSQADRTK